MEQHPIGNTQTPGLDETIRLPNAVPEVFREYAASEPFRVIDLDEETARGQHFQILARTMLKYLQFSPSTSHDVRITFYVPTLRLAKGEQKAIVERMGSARDALDKLIAETALTDDDAALRTTLYAGLLNLVKRYKTQAITAISNRALARDADEELGALLIEIGSSIDDPATERYREWLVTRSLLSESPYIRHAAATAVSSFDGATLLSAVKEAETIEDVPELKRQLQRVQEKLEQRIHGAVSETH